MLSDLDQRAREVFRLLVDEYLASGQPVGSRVIAERLSERLSPASVRNVMAALESSGLLYAPHTSAGRLPTEQGLRFFVDGLLELGALAPDEQALIEARCQSLGRSLADTLGAAGSLLSGLSAGAAVVVAPRLEVRTLRHIEFVPIAEGRALVVLVTDDGQVENRVIEVPAGVPAATLVMAGNFLAARAVGKTLAELKSGLDAELQARRHELDALTQKVIAAGVGVWSEGSGGQLIVKGQGQLLNNVTAVQDLERIRELFQALETYENMEQLVEATQAGAGVKIFIGSENRLFAHTGCALVVAPLTNAEARIVGAVGVIGPTRLNYARVVPMVDYTARVLGRLVG